MELLGDLGSNIGMILLIFYKHHWGREKHLCSFFAKNRLFGVKCGIRETMWAAIMVIQVREDHVLAQIDSSKDSDSKYIWIVEPTGFHGE
jgi:hypothetical protein